jgi:hypothetical protein
MKDEVSEELGYITINHDLYRSPDTVRTVIFRKVDEMDI